MRLETYTPDTLPAAATAPTLYFIGVTTARSSIRSVFPRWADMLGLGEARLDGIDLPLHAPAEDYQRVVDFIRRDPMSLGALVTTHKLDLFAACSDMFDEIDPLANLMGETSCLSKRAGKLVCHAKDPISSGLAIEAFLPSKHFEQTGSQMLILGAGGSAIAISWYLTRPERGANRPSRVVVTNRSRPRLEALAKIHDELGTDIPVECVHTPTPENNDALLATLRPGALVVNATGLGKDAPGSPLTSSARFPPGSLAWDLNYRGDLVFLDQARAAPGVQVEDGWVYFLHGWTQVIAEVFHIDIPASGPLFDTLNQIAAETRQ